MPKWYPACNHQMDSRSANPKWNPNHKNRVMMRDPVFCILGNAFGIPSIPFKGDALDWRPKVPAGDSNRRADSAAGAWGQVGTNHSAFHEGKCLTF